MKGKVIGVWIILTCLLSGCNTNADPNQLIDDIRPSLSNDSLVEAYTAALETVMSEDAALNSEMEFIAIDMTNFEKFKKGDKEKMLSFFEDKYDVETMDATLEKLRSEGYFNEETLVLDGVLLNVSKVDVKSKDKIVFEASKYRSGDGAIGVEIEVVYKNGRWQAGDLTYLWIS